MKKLLILVSLVLSLFLVGCNRNDNVVRLGMLRVPNDGMLAKNMGLFEEKLNALGYVVEYYYFDSGVDANKAIVSADIDFAGMGNINALVALGSNLDASLIWIDETLGDVEALAVKSNIQTVEDLRGKTIATTFASTSHYILLNVLKEAGISESEVTILDMKTSAIVAAWELGTIDAAYTWQPTLGELLADGGTVLVSSEDMIAEGYMTANVELVRTSYGEAHPEVVEAFIECLSEAYDYFNTDREAAIQDLADELELTYADVELQVSGSIWTSLADMQDTDFITGYVNTMYEQTSFLKDQDFLTRDITLSEVTAFIDNSYALDVSGN